MTGRAFFDEVDSHLFEQVPSLVRRERGDQLLFCHGQNALESDDEQIVDQISVNILGTPTHVDPPKSSAIPSQTAASISPWVFIGASPVPRIRGILHLRQFAALRDKHGKIVLGGGYQLHPTKGCISAEWDCVRPIMPYGGGRREDEIAALVRLPRAARRF